MVNPLPLLAQWGTRHAALPAQENAEEGEAVASAKEALRTEIAALLLGSLLDMETAQPRPNPWQAQWLDILQKDRHELFRAARDAEHIVQHLLSHAEELYERIESRITQNLLPKASSEQPISSDLSSDLPNFIPQHTPSTAGHWAVFARRLRAEAAQNALSEAAAERSLTLIEPKFGEMLNTAEKNGYAPNDINQLLTERLIEELRSAAFRQQQWQRFCGQVRHAAGKNYAPEQIEPVLQELGTRYQKLLVQSTQEGWTKTLTDAQIRSMIYGEDGRRPISEDYVRSLIENSPALPHTASNPEDDEDFVLTPLGFSDALPENSGALTDEIANNHDLMQDAQMQEMAYSPS